MTQHHREAIIRQWPEATGRTHTVCSDGNDIGDPIGGSVDVYRQCAMQITEGLNERVSELEFK